MAVTTTDEGTVSESASDQAPTPTDAPSDGGTGALVAGELLVEDVSIDGMCGVY